MATIQLACIVIDCGDPTPITRFYEAALGGQVTGLGETGAYVTVSGMVLAIRKVDGYRPPTWPSSDVPMQIHMDFNVDDLDAAEAFLLQHGATTPEYQAHRQDGLVVMLDPAGHPFCIGLRV